MILFTFINPFKQGDRAFDFHFANCLDYIKAGVEAIIEDEVTSRFEAEELKNWNLLTRTNRYYEFISWRLTIIWFIGFFIRYFILMPFRVLICFVGVRESSGAPYQNYTRFFLSTNRAFSIILSHLPPLIPLCCVY